MKPRRSSDKALGSLEINQLDFRFNRLKELVPLINTADASLVCEQAGFLLRAVTDCSPPPPCQGSVRRLDPLFIVPNARLHKQASNQSHPTTDWTKRHLPRRGTMCSP